MTVERILSEWLGPSAVAFRLSNGRIITVPAQDLDQLGRLCFAASIEWRNHNDGVDRSPIEPHEHRRETGPGAGAMGN